MANGFPFTPFSSFRLVNSVRFPISHLIKPSWNLARPVCVLSAFLMLVATSFGGGGPENILLVVNSLSRDSMTIANHYCQLRQIPDANVLHLEWSGSRESIDVQTFRDRILAPIFTTIDQRQIDDQIDYIVYSSGFPYVVNFSSDIQQQQPREAGNHASLTGLTFFNVAVRSRQTPYVYRLNEKSNYYESTWTRGFRNRYGWNRQGQRVQRGGDSYHLSMMLGYTDGRGNTVDEVIQYLRRSALADGSQPSGTIYLMRNADVRSVTRHDAFSHVAASLKKLGVNVEVLDGTLPPRKADVMGAVVGRAAFNWARSGSQILPGAICDNLTSFGGIMRSSGTQTPLSEFLRFGAAGTSGTVVEPFALQAKFPHPWMHVHYARGASLAEAFYQSIAAPYQLLIVGDPLCRPWSNSPTFVVDGLSPGETVNGPLVLTPRLIARGSVSEFQLFVDGRYRRQCRPGDSFEIDTKGLADGHHEVRVLAIEDSSIESQARLIIPFNVNNNNLKLEAAVQSPTVFENQRCRLFLSCKEATAIHVYHHRRRLGVINQAMGQMMIDTTTMGRGPVRLQAIAVTAERGKRKKVFSAPIKFEIRPVGEFSATEGRRGEVQTSLTNLRPR